MRLAVIRQRYTPYGGAERFVEGALEALLERGVAISLYTREWPETRLQLIEPTIVATHLVDPFEREVLTWAKGDATVLVKVVFRDATTGEAVAEPVFHRSSPYFWAAWSSGVTDAELDRRIVGDVVTYVRDNL